MKNKEFVLETFKKYGKSVAKEVQEKAPEMTGTELYEEFGYIPSFYAAIAKKNMLQRKAGKDGFICRSPQGRVVRLIQQYDSTIHTQEPEELRAHWRFVWSKNPKHALPFVCITESPYGMDECCLGSDGVVYASNIETNTWDPVVNPQFWRVAEGV